MSAGRHSSFMSVHVYGHNFWTAQPIFKMLGILERADQGLSDSIKNKQNWEKSLYPPYGLNLLRINKQVKLKIMIINL